MNFDKKKKHLQIGAYYIKINPIECQFPSKYVCSYLWHINGHERWTVRVYVQQLILADNKEIPKPFITGLLWGECTSVPGIPLRKSQ